MEFTRASYKHDFGNTITTDALDVSVNRASIAHLHIEDLAAAANDVIVDAAAAPSGEGAKALVITEFEAQPDTPRNLTVTIAATTTGHIAAGNVVVAGKNYAGEDITENFAVTADTAGTITGNLAFKEVTSVTVPVQDGDSVTVSVGIGKKIGIPYRLVADEQVILKLFNNTADSGIITNDATNLEKNVISLNGSPDGQTPLDLYIVV